MLRPLRPLDHPVTLKTLPAKVRTLISTLPPSYLLLVLLHLEKVLKKCGDRAFGELPPKEKAVVFLARGAELSERLEHLLWLSPKQLAAWLEYELRHPRWRERKARSLERDYALETRHVRTIEIDITETPRSLTIACLSFFGRTECELEAKWFLHLRECWGLAVDESKRQVRDMDAFHAEVSEQVRRDGALIRQIGKPGAGGAMFDDVLETMRIETKRLATRLEASAAPPVGWSWAGEDTMHEPPLVRGPDLAPRRRVVVVKPRSDVVGQTQLRAQRQDERLERVRRLLRRYPEGLSENELRKRLRMGRAQLTKTLQAGVTTNALEVKGSLVNPRYCVTSEVIRKVPPKKGGKG
jgi:hypothetical protein